MPALSRRSFLTLVGLSSTALFRACDATPPPSTSPFLVGPYETGQAILGEDAGTTGMPQLLTTRDLPVAIDQYHFTCRDGRAVPVDLPSRVPAAVYYPLRLLDPYVRGPNPLNIRSGPFPVLLYAHGVRLQSCSSPFPIDRDFTRMGAMLRHVASYGCVAVAPDLSWLPGDLPGSVTLEQAFDLRARVLSGYYSQLMSLNATLFANQLDLSRVILVGHSTGGGACTLAGSRLAAAGNLKSLAYGLIAPYFARQSPTPTVNADTRKLLVLQGTEDTISGPDATASYNAGGAPKTLVTIPGANHFGYTNLCELDNTCDPAVGTAGTISRTGQQQTAAAYLAAALRYYALDDVSARPYLSGERMVEGLEFWDVTGVQVQQNGVKQPPVVHP